MEDIGKSPNYKHNITKSKRNINMDRAFQCQTIVYQLVKLSMF